MFFCVDRGLLQLIAFCSLQVLDRSFYLCVFFTSFSRSAAEGSRCLLLGVWGVGPPAARVEVGGRPIDLEASDFLIVLRVVLAVTFWKDLIPDLDPFGITFWDFRRHCFRLEFECGIYMKIMVLLEDPLVVK